VRYWTKLQQPFDQAVYVDNGKIVDRIPENPPSTPARRVACIGQLGDKLLLIRSASWELWDKHGQEMLTGAPEPLLYACHAAEQWSPTMALICSSGLELFVILDTESREVVWKWWAHEKGYGGQNPHFGDGGPDWQVKQVSARSYQVPRAEAAHFNSVYVQGGAFITSALWRRTVYSIVVADGSVTTMLTGAAEGLHTPIMHDDKLIYGCKQGIVVRRDKMEEHHLPELIWPKYLRPTPWGYIVTHEGGVTAIDEKWQIIKTDVMPVPFGIAHLEGQP